MAQYIIPAVAATFLTFTASTQAAPVKSMPGLVSITFVEQTGSQSSFTYGVNSPELNMRLADPLSGTNQDFNGVSDENYDVFYSDSNGTFNVNGEYVSVEAVFPRTQSGGGLNIAAIRYNFTLGSVDANNLASYLQLGSNAIVGSELKAVDGNISTATTMGNTAGYPTDARRLRLTVNLIPEPASFWLVILGLGSLLGVSSRLRYPS